MQPTFHSSSPINLHGLGPPQIKLAPPPPPPFPSRTLAPAPRHCSATDSSTPLDTCCRAGQVMEVEASLRSTQLPRQLAQPFQRTPPRPLSQAWAHHAYHPHHHYRSAPTLL